MHYIALNITLHCTETLILRDICVVREEPGVSTALLDQAGPGAEVLAVPGCLLDVGCHDRRGGGGSTRTIIREQHWD